MIIDSFIFFNEIDLLEIRLNTLNDYVNEFVIIEADRTFQGNPKPYYFQQNISRYKQFLDKIVYIKYAMPESNNPELTSWAREILQRNAIDKGINILKPKDDDIILISDCDEIPNHDKFHEILLNTRNKLNQKLYYYYLNCYNITSGEEGCTNSTIAVSYKLFKQYTVQDLRLNKPNLATNFVINAGWHFSYLGGVDKIIEKIQSFAHTELNNDFYCNRNKIQQYINENKDLFGREHELFEIVKIDDSYPEWLVKNIDKYKQFVK